MNENFGNTCTGEAALGDHSNHRYPEEMTGGHLVFYGGHIPRLTPIHSEVCL